MKTMVYAVSEHGYYKSASGLSTSFPYGQPYHQEIFMSRAGASERREQLISEKLATLPMRICETTENTVFLEYTDGREGIIGLTIMMLDLIAPDKYHCDGFVARNADGELHLFRTIPVPQSDDEYGPMTDWYDSQKVALPENMYPEVTWATGPLWVEITIERKTH